MNRRAFLDRLEAEIVRSRRAGSEFCIALFDLDEFNAVSDVYGHAVGDQALIRVADTLLQTLRQSDTASRFGGDEFILLLPESTPAEAAEILDRLRGDPIVVPDRAGSRARVSLSWGMASWPHDGKDVERLLRVAGRRLYALKGGGRTPHPRQTSDSPTADP